MIYLIDKDDAIVGSCPIYWYDGVTPANNH